MKIAHKAGQTVAFVGGMPIKAPNTVLESEAKNYYLSYNSSCSGYGCATTALVLYEPTHSEVFLILKGKHIDKLKDLSLKECLLYFIDNYKDIHSMGDEGLNYLQKCIENIDNNVSLFTDNLDKWTIFCQKTLKDK